MVGRYFYEKEGQARIGYYVSTEVALHATSGWYARFALRRAEHLLEKLCDSIDRNGAIPPNRLRKAPAGETIRFHRYSVGGTAMATMSLVLDDNLLGRLTANYHMTDRKVTGDTDQEISSKKHELRRLIDQL